MKFLIKEMTPQLWEDLERLFGEKGACGGCWCMWWRIEKGEEWKNIKGPEAKNRLRTMIENGTRPVPAKIQMGSDSMCR